MQESTTSTSWRTQLGEMIHEVSAREQLAEQIGVNPITLMRWAASTSSPRLQEIQALLRALPDRQGFKQALLRELLGTDADGLQTSTSPSSWGDGERSGLQIPSGFYADTLRAARDMPQRFWTIVPLVLRQMLTQLDPKRMGMEVIVAQCMPPRSDGKVHSLHERVGQGTPPWPNNYPEEKNLFLGAESLAGYAVAQGHWVATTGADQQAEVLPSKEVPNPYEVSMAAFPVVLEGNVAGCLLVSSTQIGYFTRERLQLIDNYADLVRLAFRDADFYPPSAIELGVMPHWRVQLQRFSTLRQRVALVQREARQSERLLDALAAERLVRQQLEAEFLQLQGEKAAAHEFSRI